MKEYLLAFLPALLGAVLTALGMGGGGVLLIYLTAALNTEQLVAQGINLLFFLPVAVVSLCVHFKNKLVKVKPALLLFLPALPGALLGVYLAGLLPGEWLRRIFALLLLVIGVRELMACKKKSTDLHKPKPRDTN